MQECKTGPYVSIGDRIKRVDELLGSIAHITTGQGPRANAVWDQVANLLDGLRRELKV